MTHPTDTAKSEELKGCPMCGSGPARREGRFTNASFSGVEVMDEIYHPYVWCGTCGLRTRSCDSVSEAIEVWSERAHPVSSPPQNDAGVEVVALRSALRNLLDACYQADGAENLPEEIDGSLLDAASEALELQYPIIWTDEQVAMLEKRQADSSLHPYTCGGDRSDRAHRWHADESGEEAGLLYPTVRGWKCPACDYRQFWSHETGGPLSELQALGQEFEAGEWHNAVERLGEALFAMSDSLRRSHWIERPENHAIYEKVVAAFQALPSAPSGEG